MNWQIRNLALRRRTFSELFPPSATETHRTVCKVVGAETFINTWVRKVHAYIIDEEIADQRRRKRILYTYEAQS